MSSSWWAVSVTHTCKGARLVPIANMRSLFSLYFLSPSLTAFLYIFYHTFPSFITYAPSSSPSVSHSLSTTHSPLRPSQPLDIFKHATVYGEGAVNVLTQTSKGSVSVLPINLPMCPHRNFVDPLCLLYVWHLTVALVSV